MCIFSKFLEIVYHFFQAIKNIHTCTINMIVAMHVVINVNLWTNNESGFKSLPVIQMKI